MQRGFPYLITIMGGSIRKVLAWQVSNTMDVGFCVERQHLAASPSADHDAPAVDLGADTCQLSSCEEPIDTGSNFTGSASMLVTQVRSSGSNSQIFPQSFCDGSPANRSSIHAKVTVALSWALLPWSPPGKSTYRTGRRSRHARLAKALVTPADTT